MALGTTGKFELDAAIDSSPGSLSIKGSGAVAFSLAGASFNGNLKLDFKTSAAGTKALFSGSFAVDLKIFKYNVNVITLEYDSAKGGLQALDVSAGGEVNFGVGRLDASGRFTYAKNPKPKIHINLSGTFSIWAVYTRSVTLDLDLGPIKLPFSFGPKAGAVRIPTTLGVVRVSGLNEAAITAGEDLKPDTKVISEVEVESCDLFEFFCLDVNSVNLNRQTGVLEGKVLGIFDLSVTASQLVTKKNDPPNYTTRFGNLVNESQGRCLEVPAAKYNDQQQLGTYNCVGVRHEQWQLSPPGLFHACWPPSKCLDATINKGENARPILFTLQPECPQPPLALRRPAAACAVTFGNQDRCLTAEPTTTAAGEVRMASATTPRSSAGRLSGRMTPRRLSRRQQLPRTRHRQPRARTR